MCYSAFLAGNAESECEGDFGWSEWLALVVKRPTIHRRPTHFFATAARTFQTLSV